MSDEKIRLGVWVTFLTPVVVVAGLFVYLVMPVEKPAPRHAAASAPETDEPPAPSAEAPPSPVPPPPVQAAAPTAIAAAAVAPQTTAPLDSSKAFLPPPEPIPELEAMRWRPRGSEQWTTEQKDEYRQKLLDDLRARERTLQSEAAAARSAGDTATEQRKTATLTYLRDQRSQLEDRMRRASTDAGS